MVEAFYSPDMRVVGLKQTLRVLQQDRVAIVYLADDVDDHIRRKIAAACAERDVRIVSAGVDQRELGSRCRIEVGAAMVAILKSQL
jgi:large subunit ribosomal protein L7A